MANELTIAITLEVTLDGVTRKWPREEQSITVTGTRFVWHKQEVGTSEEALELGDISTGGWAIMANRDSTNFVEIRSGTGGTNLIKIKAGETCCVRLSGDASAPYAIADTAAVELEIFMLED